MLDIGSNTVHLLVVDAYYGAAPVPAHSQKIELRLAEHIDEDGKIDKALARTLSGFVSEALRVGEDLGVTEVDAFATSAIRDAKNGRAILEQVHEHTGVRVNLLSGVDEARLTFLAVRRWFGWSAGRLLSLDIGGGSLEMAIGFDEEPDEAVSLPLGAGRLTQAYLAQSDPPDPEALRELRRYVRVTIAEALAKLRRGEAARRVVVTSKTFRSLARIAGAAPYSEGEYVPRTLTRADLSRWTPKIAAMTLEERLELPGVSEGRAGQLVAGAVVAEAAMDLFDVDEVHVCPWALREGVILRHLDGLRR